MRLKKERSNLTGGYLLPMPVTFSKQLELEFFHLKNTKVVYAILSKIVPDNVQMRRLM